MSERIEKRTLSLSINGEFITRLARERFFYEAAGYKKTMDLLLSCMCGTEMSERKPNRYAEDVLIGRAEFKGNTSDGTFCMMTYDPDDEAPEVPEAFNIFKRFGKTLQKLKETEKELQKMQWWYSVAMEHVPTCDVDNVLRETDQSTESKFGDDMLTGFMERMLDEEEHSTEDYGWLAPDGAFHEVKWGSHQEWAEQYIRNNMTEEQWLEAGIHCPGQFKSGTLNNFGDWLVERGWVLLHSPWKGIAKPTRNPQKRYTKAQKEFLYDYYMERNCEKEANAIWEEDI